MEQNIQPNTFHIGFHKTGTTYLQESIFPYATNARVSRGWVNMRELCHSEPRECWLHSDESISGKPWGGKITYGDSFRNNLSICLKTFRVNKYIVTVRPLESWTKSLWKQYVHEGGHINPSSFFNGTNPVINLEECFMAPKIAWLKKHADVLVISQQELKENESKVTEKISTFTGIQFDFDQIKDGRPGKELNVGITSELQTQFLLSANKMNNRYFRKSGLTPRYIAQHRLSRANQTPFNIDFNFTQQQLDSIKRDWEELNTHL